MISVKNKNELRRIILNKKVPLELVDVSKITDLSFIFKNVTSVLGCFSNWDVSNCENMRGIFQFSKIDCNISNWDVSNVINLEYAFEESYITADLSNWNVSNVKYMNGIFIRAKNRSNLSKWNIKNVVDLDLKRFAYGSNIEVPSEWKILKILKHNENE